MVNVVFTLMAGILLAAAFESKRAGAYSLLHGCERLYAWGHAAEGVNVEQFAVAVLRRVAEMPINGEIVTDSFSTLVDYHAHDEITAAVVLVSGAASVKDALALMSDSHPPSCVIGRK